MILQQLKNSYFMLRHGKSVPNEKDLIVSDPKNGIEDYGLITEGKDQVEKSVEKAKKDKILDEKTIIVSSDFLRTLESAKIARKILNSEPIVISPKLRERFFGDWEKTNGSNYQKVWDEDSKDSNHKINNVESPNEVVQRVVSLINDLEKIYNNETILLVSHGDILQALQSYFEKIPFSSHTVEFLKTAEIRRLHLKQ